jgi:hypothetical protein
MSVGTLKLSGAWLLPAIALLAACASNSGIPLNQRDSAQRDRYLDYAGPPVDHFTYLGRYDGWQPLGRYEAVLFTNPSDAYLISVYPPCEDLSFANHIALTSTANTVYQRFDFVRVHGAKCMIKEIRPINYQQMKADTRAQAAEAKAADKAAAQSSDR